MKRLLFVTAALLVAIAVQAYAFGSLVSSFRAPGNSPTGVAFLSKTVYIDTSPRSQPDICWETTTTGSVISSFTSPTTRTMGTAVGSIGGTLYRWIVSYSPEVIYRVVATTGKIVGSFDAPGLYPYGVAFRDPSYIYYTPTKSQAIYLMHATTGSVYASYSVSFYPTDLAYDPSGYLWTADSIGVIRKSTLTGSTTASFSVAAYGLPGGCGYGGGYVWVGFMAPLYSILQFTTVIPSVCPTSLGRVKALYR